MSLYVIIHYNLVDEFGLGLWRQSSADLANHLQCKMIILVEEHQPADRGIRANKPW